MNTLPPLRFERHFVEKVWGGRRLAERPGIDLPDRMQVGETWEVVDREKENSRVAEGPFAGRTLHELMLEHGPAILGKNQGRRDGRFPLLVKFLDASDDLSVQVHPDDALAERLGDGSEGKTEAWYVVDVAEGGALYAGLDPKVTAEYFRSVADKREVEDTLVRHDVKAGDCVLITGGTVHAIGKGVTILEVQQNSDTTYRLWDWGRVGLDGKPRETHVEQGLVCTKFGAEPPSPHAGVWMPNGTGFKAELTTSDYFSMTAHRVGSRLAIEGDDRFRIHVVLSGRGALTAEAFGNQRFELAPGTTYLVPASTGAHEIVAEGGELSLVELGGA